MAESAKYCKELKDRFRASSFDAFDDREKLALLLSYSTFARDVRVSAKELQLGFGTVRGVMDATGEELASLGGLGDTTATFFHLLKEVAGIYLLGSLVGSVLEASLGELIDYLHLTLSTERVEKFLAVYIDSDDKVVAVDLLHEGTINRTAVYPRKAIERAFARKACSVIFVHNHPSGDSTPSRSDGELAVALERAAASVELRVVDHLIIGRNGHYSARAGVPGQRPR